MVSLKNVRHEKFAQLVAQGYRRTEAFRLAGFVGNYATSPKPLMTRPEVSARVDELVSKAADKAQVTIDRVVRELSLIALANPQNYCDDDGQPLALHQLTRDQAAAIQDLTVIETFDGKGRVASRRYRYKLHDKRAALETLGKHLGLFGPDFSVNTAVLINNQRADADREQLEAMLEGALREVERKRSLMKDPVPVEPVPVEPARPRLTVVETDKPLSTTEAYIQWANQPLKPP
jgi:phage terminase small subunit